MLATEVKTVASKFLN